MNIKEQTLYRNLMGGNDAMISNIDKALFWDQLLQILGQWHKQRN